MKNYITPSNPSRQEKVLTTIKYAVLIAYAALSIYPFIWVVLSSFRTNTGIYSNPFAFPEVWKFENYSTAYHGANISRSILNTFFYSCSATAAVLLLSSMTAYVLSRINRSFLLYIFFTIGIMIPIHSVLIPLVTIIKSMGLLNTRLGLILAYIAGNLSFSTFILVSFLDAVPKEIEEAARIDGASLIRTFFSVVLPITKPGLATAGTFVFLFCWNDFILALLLASKQKIQTLNLAAYNLSGLYIRDYGIVCAGLVMLILPIMIIYMIFQEQVIKGLTAGAVKG